MRRCHWLVLTGFACSAAHAQTPVRVATWNIEGVGTRASSQYNAALMTIRRLEPDVVGINEIASNTDVQNFLLLAQDAGYPHRIVPSTNPFGTMRNGFMSRFPITASTIHTSRDLSGDILANDITRYHVEITVDVPGEARDLTLITQHWKASSNTSDYFRRAVESVRIAQSLEAVDVDRDAYIVMGDINEEIHSVPRTPNPFFSIPSGMPSGWRLGSDLAQVLATTGIVNDPFYHLSRMDGPAMTALFARQTNGSFTTRPESGRRLDYILTSPAITGRLPVGEVFNSVNEALPGLPKFGAALPSGTSLIASDHYLVFADITVPPMFNPPTVLGFSTLAKVPGVGNVSPQDLVCFDEEKAMWLFLFDGRDVGLDKARISALAVLPSGQMLVAFAAETEIIGLFGGPNGYRVEPTDIVMFEPPHGLGAPPRPVELVPMFVFHGRSVGLDTATEAIDALHVLPDGRLLISTAGPLSVSGLTAADTDIVAFTPKQLGAKTQGTFARYFTGSQVGLSPNTSEDIDALAITREGHMLISTLGSFDVAGVSGTGQDILRFIPTSLGATTAGVFSIHSRPVRDGLDPTANISAIHILDD